MHATDDGINLAFHEIVYTLLLINNLHNNQPAGDVSPTDR
jgi:hypothetical protein